MRSQNFIDIVLIHQYWFRNSANLIHRSNYAPFETKTSSYYLMILHTSAWKNKALLFLVSFSHRGNCHLHSQLSFFLGRVYLDISHISNSNIGRCGIVSVGTIWCVTPHLDHEMIHHIDSIRASYSLQDAFLSTYTNIFSNFYE